MTDRAEVGAEDAGVDDKTLPVILEGVDGDCSEPVFPNVGLGSVVEAVTDALPGIETPKKFSLRDLGPGAAKHSVEELAVADLGLRIGPARVENGFNSGPPLVAKFVATPPELRSRGDVLPKHDRQAIEID